jgi:hypothetical protein
MEGCVMRLIDADALMELYEMGDELKNYEKVLSVPLPVIQQNIKDMPTIDAVEVVRCKDCKHLYQDTFDDSLWCCRDVDREVVENHFCSYGERRESDGT